VAIWALIVAAALPNLDHRPEQGRQPHRQCGGGFAKYLVAAARTPLIRRTSGAPCQRMFVTPHASEAAPGTTVWPPCFREIQDRAPSARDVVDGRGATSTISPLRPHPQRWRQKAPVTSLAHERGLLLLSVTMTPR